MARTGSCSGSIVSLGYNIDNGNSCVGGGITGDKPFTNPELDPDGLQNNGGFTETFPGPMINGSMADPSLRGPTP